VKRSLVALLVLSLSCVSGVYAQQQPGSQTVVPSLIKFGGHLVDSSGKPYSNIAGVTFALYKDQQGGAALWMETQNVNPDATGRYTVFLGSMTTNGLPLELFSEGEARWLGVQIEGKSEEPRVLLVAVPYALKAADAETLGGKPASAFALAAPNAPSGTTSQTGTGTATPSLSGQTSQTVITGNGTPKYLPIWTSNTNLGISTLYQTNGNVGINTTSPTAKLEVNGATILEGLLTLSPSGTSALKVTGSAFGVSNTGVVTFASGQSFPGAGTITGVTAGTDLTGGGTSGAVTLNLDITKVPQLNANNIFTGSVSATQLNSTAAQGTAPLQVSSTTQVTNLNASLLDGLSANAFQPAGSYATLGANSFAGNQSVTGNVAATGSVSGGMGNFAGLVTAEAGALLPPSGPATQGQGVNSQPIDSVASAYNSNTNEPQNQDFQWLAEPVGNNTSSPSGKLDLLFGANGAAPTETGLSIASNGQITFATGQTFSGIGTVTSVGSGAGLTGGPITTSGTLSIATGGVSNAMLANASTTINAGPGLTGGGLVPLGGNLTLSIDPTKIPVLNGNNTFSGSITATAFAGSGAQQGALAEWTGTAPPYIVSNSPITDSGGSLTSTESISAPSINTSGSGAGQVQLGSGAAIVTWTLGAGVPASSCNVGSLFSRIDGGANSTLYVCEGPAPPGQGTWVAK
jgi:hypothetical protein